jgi:hypothetical protein
MLRAHHGSGGLDGLQGVDGFQGLDGGGLST